MNEEQHVISSLHKKVAVLEKELREAREAITQLSKMQKAAYGAWQYDHARFMADYSIMVELAEKEGVPSEALHKHYETRVKFWYDHALRRVEKSRPALAAEIDNRAIEDCNTLHRYPSIFEEPVE